MQAIRAWIALRICAGSERWRSCPRDAPFNLSGSTPCRLRQARNGAIARRTWPLDGGGGACVVPVFKGPFPPPGTDGMCGTVTWPTVTGAVAELLPAPPPPPPQPATIHRQAATAATAAGRAGRRLTEAVMRAALSPSG